MTDDEFLAISLQQKELPEFCWCPNVQIFEGSLDFQETREFLDLILFVDFWLYPCNEKSNQRSAGVKTTALLHIRGVKWLGRCPCLTKIALGLNSEDFPLFSLSQGPLKANIHIFSDGLSEND